MNRVALTAVIVALSLSLPMMDAEAKRLGGGGSSGMKRSVPTQSHDASKPTPAPQQAAPAQGTPATPAAAAAAAPKRSWMGPLAGLAAGLGIAALFSHFGMGGALASGITMLLLGLGAVLLIGFLMRRFGGNKLQNNSGGMAFAGANAGAGAGANNASAPFQPYQPASAPAAYLSPQPAALAQPTGTAAIASTSYAPATPAAVSGDGFDTAGFEQIAKRVFIRMQAANDTGDQNDLRRFTTPEMFGVVQQELLDRKVTTQRTDVVKLDAQVIERLTEDGQQIVSVRFWGLIREQEAAPAEEFDEIWHLVRPLDESREWAIAGIQQTQRYTV